MLKPMPASSEEDSTTPHDREIDCAEYAFSAAAAYANAIDEEWLISLCLNPELKIMDIHEVFRSRICRPCPDEALEALITAAERCCPHELVIVRYHLDPWRGPRRKGMRRLHAFRLQLQARGLHLQDAFVADSTGEIYPILGEPSTIVSGHKLL